MEEGGGRHSPGGVNHFQVHELNTKGCCVLCFKPVIPLQDDATVTVREVYPIDKLCRYLRLDVGVILKRLVNGPSTSSSSASPSSSGSEHHHSRTLLKVTLCKECAVVTSKFSELCQQLGEFQGEMGNQLKLIQTCIAEAEGDPNRVEHFYRLMASDPESQTCLEVLDELRSRIFIKSACAVGVANEDPNSGDHHSEGPLDDLWECFSMNNCRCQFDKVISDWTTEADPNPNDNQNQEDDGSHQDPTSFSEGAYPYLEISECSPNDPAGEAEGRNLNISSNDSPYPDVTFVELSSASEEEIGDDDHDQYHNQILETKSKFLGDGSLVLDSPKSVPMPGGRNLEVFHIPSKPTTSPPTGEEGIPEPVVSPPPADPNSETYYKVNHLTLKYSCTACSKSFDTKNGASKHFESFHLRLRHKCGRCEKDFHSRASYIRHFTMAHLNVRFMCENCDSLFTLMTNLRQHQRLRKCFSIGGRQRKVMTNANGDRIVM